jgi:hypothetical protein
VPNSPVRLTAVLRNSSWWRALAATLVAAAAAACSNFLEGPSTPSPTGGSSFRVESVVAGVDNATVAGACPKRVTLTGTITATSSGTVTFKWERSDGAATPNANMTFTGAGAQTTTLTWDTSGSGWQQLHVLTPNDVKSNQVNVSVSCAS